MEKFEKIDQCVCCGNSDLRKVLDLGEQSLANSYVSNPEEIEDKFPLAINFCNKCTHIQLTHAVDADLLFRNYLYVSGTSRTLCDFFQWFVGFATKYVSNAKNVLDIACNDGTQLNFFQDAGYETFGIDPSINLYDISSIRHDVRLDYLNDSYAEEYKNFFDIITAQNVFAHNSYPKEFLELCKRMLTDNGMIFVQVSQVDMVERNQFDTIYHEHISFFNPTSMYALVREAGLYVVDMVKHPIHGSSLITVISKNPPLEYNPLITQRQITDSIVDQYAQQCLNVSKIFSDNVAEIKSKGYKVVGYGAAAKGNTFLNFTNVKLDYIVDDNPLKQGLYTPQSNIRITSIEELSLEDDNICIVPLAWNFFDEIVSRCMNKLSQKNIIFLKYFPNSEIVRIQEAMNA